MDDEPVDSGAPASEPTATEGGNWFDSFAEDIKTNQNVTKFGSAEELAKSYINAQQLIGRDKIPMPVTDEDWSNTYARLGRPEEPTGYEINAPEGIEVDADKQQAFFNLAHEIGLSQKQAEALAAFDFDTHGSAMEQLTQQQQQATDAALGQLKNEWGQAFDQNVQIANRALSEFASEADIDFLNNAEIDGVRLGDHPALVKLFNNIGKGMLEGGKLEGKGTEMALTPQEIQDKVQSLMAHQAYTDSRHPEHKQIARQVQELFKLQYPE